MGTYVFDIDGTLSQDGKPISESIIRSIEILSKENNIVFASARPVRDMLPMVKETLHDKAVFIWCNGGMAFKSKKIIYCSKLDKDYGQRYFKFS